MDDNLRSIDSGLGCLGHPLTGTAKIVDIPTKENPVSSITDVEQRAWQAAVRAALPTTREQHKPPKGADRFEVSRAKHQAIDAAYAIASGVAVEQRESDPTTFLPAQREAPEVVAAREAYRSVMRGES